MRSLWTGRKRFGFAKAPMPTTSTFLNLLDAIREKQIPTGTARAGDVFPLGEGTLTVLGDGVAAENLNDISLVTLFEAPGLRCLSSARRRKGRGGRGAGKRRGCTCGCFQSGASRLVHVQYPGISGCGAPAGRCGLLRSGQFLRTSPQRGAGRVCKCGGAGLPYRYGGNNHCVCRQGGGSCGDVLFCNADKRNGGVMTRRLFTR